MLSSPVSALDFGSSRRAAVLFDAPASSAQKVAVVSAGYPLEKIISTQGWIKVRDETGALAWIEADILENKRTLLVTHDLAAALDKPLDTATVRFKVQRGVMLTPVAPMESGWIKVRHASGQEGYMRVRHLWGL